MRQVRPLIQMSSLIGWTHFHDVQWSIILTMKISYSNVCIRFRHMKSSTFETKSLDSRNSLVGHSNLILGSTQIRDVDLFMYLIEGIRFGT